MRHWVFDLDGTLVDSFGHYFAALEALYARHGIEVDEKLRHEALTRPIADIFAERLGAAEAAIALAELNEQCLEDALHIRPFDGISDLLAELARQPSRLAVWTNRDLESATLILKSTGLDRFAELCVSGGCVTPKPSSDGLHRISERFACRPSDVIMVGDHEHDVLASQTAGARAVRASWHGYWPIGRCESADHQFYTVGEFASWTRSLLNAV